MFAPLALSLALSPALAASPDGEAVAAASASVGDAVVGDADALGKRKGGRGGGGGERAGGGERSGGGERREGADGASAERREGGEHREAADGAGAQRREGGERHEAAEGAAAERRGAPRPSAPASADRHHVPAHAPAVRHAPASHHAAAHHAEARGRHHAAWVARHRPAHWYSPWRPGAPRYWYHGVFVYGPPVAVVGPSGGGSRARTPERAVDRAGKFALGFHGGSYLSDFGGGGGYGDAGLGLSLSYRPIEPLAFEVAWTYHDASWSKETARIQQPLQVSAELYAFPWSRVSPYVLAGVTATGRNLDQPLPGGDLETDASLWGPHGGLGIQFALGERVALDLDARLIGYVNKPASDPSAPGALQANLGLDFYF